MRRFVFFLVTTLAAASPTQVCTNTACVCRLNIAGYCKVELEKDDSENHRLICIDPKPRLLDPLRFFNVMQLSVSTEVDRKHADIQVFSEDTFLDSALGMGSARQQARAFIETGADSFLGAALGVASAFLSTQAKGESTFDVSPFYSTCVVVKKKAKVGSLGAIEVRATQHSPLAAGAAQRWLGAAGLGLLLLLNADAVAYNAAFQFGLGGIVVATAAVTVVCLWLGPRNKRAFSAYLLAQVGRSPPDSSNTPPPPPPLPGRPDVLGGVLTFLGVPARAVCLPARAAAGPDARGGSGVPQLDPRVPRRHLLHRPRHRRLLPAQARSLGRRSRACTLTLSG